MSDTAVRDFHDKVGVRAKRLIFIAPGGFGRSARTFASAKGKWLGDDKDDWLLLWDAHTLRNLLQDFGDEWCRKVLACRPSCRAHTQIPRTNLDTPVHETQQSKLLRHHVPSQHTPNNECPRSALAVEKGTEEEEEEDVESADDQVGTGQADGGGEGHGEFAIDEFASHSPSCSPYVSARTPLKSHPARLNGGTSRMPSASADASRVSEPHSDHHTSSNRSSKKLKFDHLEVPLPPLSVFFLPLSRSLS